MATPSGFQRIPPMSANYGQACYSCYAEHSVERPISKCGACKRIGYCSSACQKKDWPTHKQMCKALRTLEDSGSAMSLHFYNLSDPTAGDKINLQELAELTNMSIHADVYAVETSLGRSLNVIERNIFAWEPRCAACGINERMLRIRAREAPGSSTQLQKCMDCQSTFFCSPRHWALVKKTHNTVPASVDYENKTSCQINQRIREDIRLSNHLLDAKIASGAVTAEGGPSLTWTPERTVDKWTSLKGANWEGEYLETMKKEFPLPEGVSIVPFLRAASDTLALPLSILYALDQLNGDDDSFTRKEVLSIHVIGASSPEIQNAMAFEEILHRLPEVKRIELLFCGPDMGMINGTGKKGGVAMNMQTCPTCDSRDRNRVQIMSSKLYHEFVADDKDFVNPDLAIAFNSGASEVERESWEVTMKVLVERKIPSVFTSFNRGEAEKEAAILTELGANLLPALGPCRNPWGSMLIKVEPGSVEGFYNSNGWLAGGFK